MKKKIAAVLVSALVALSVFSGCTGGQESQTEETEVQEVSPQETEDQAAEEDTEPADVEVMALKGPTAMGMVKFMDDVDSGSVTSENYNFSIAAFQFEEIFWCMCLFYFKLAGSTFIYSLEHILNRITPANRYGYREHTKHGYYAFLYQWTAKSVS